MYRYVLGTALTLVLAAAQVWGGAPAPAQGQKPTPNNPWSMWDIQQMITRATNEVTKRYNLTPDQTEFTRNLIVTGVNKFLDKHETKIREIFGEIIRYQMAGQDPPAEKVQEWTDVITPMFDEAKAQIIEGNHEFRTVLTDDQKKIHDIDLKVMEQNFVDAQKRLDRWKEGGFDPAKDLGHPPRKAPVKAADGKAQPEPARQQAVAAADATNALAKEQEASDEPGHSACRQRKDQHGRVGSVRTAIHQGLRTGRSPKQPGYVHSG